MRFPEQVESADANVANERERGGQRWLQHLIRIIGIIVIGAIGPEFGRINFRRDVVFVHDEWPSKYFELFGYQVADLESHIY
jgi:hypothetical protein